MADRYLLAKRLAWVAAALALAASVVVVALYWVYPETTVIVIRHAEKAIDPPSDPPLTDDGEARARTLAEVLDRSGVSVIYVTQMLRSQQTAQPLATSRHIRWSQYNYTPCTSTPPAADDACIPDVNQLIDRVYSRRNTGGVILIVGHNDTVPLIVEKLGGGSVTVGNQFDNLFVLRANSLTRTAQLIKATYGAPR